ncbi:MAG: hypothetical protein LIO94_04740 [Clostridiales bacterium]|nr:hypothetical protein [Clostridiales bacterium]
MPEYREIKDELENKGYVISDSEFDCIVEYARRKAETSGKDEGYLPLLIPDVVKEYFFRTACNMATVLMEDDTNKKIKEAQHNE